MQSPDFWERFKAYTNHEVIFLFLVGGCIGEGIMAIWVFNYDLLVSSGALKLIVLSLAFTIPLVGFNSGFFTFITLHEPDNEGKRWRMRTVPSGLFFSFIFLGGLLLISYLFNLEFPVFLIGMVILEILYAVVCKCCARFRKKVVKMSPNPALEPPPTAPSGSDKP